MVQVEQQQRYVQLIAQGGQRERRVALVETTAIRATGAIAGGSGFRRGACHLPRVKITESGRGSAVSLEQDGIRIA